MTTATTTTTATTIERCHKCNGHGEVPSGYDRFGSALSAWRVCPVCDGLGGIEVAVEVDEEPVAEELPAGWLEIDGHVVYAPAFRDAAHFDTAVGRAFADGLEVERIGPNTVAVHNPTNGNTYHASRRHCTCPAGERGTACKHIARAILAADVLGEFAPAAAAVA